MKFAPIFAAMCILSALLAAPLFAQTFDPTHVAAPAAEVLKAQITEFRNVQLRALVSTGEDAEGIALLEPKDQPAMLVRPGSTFVLHATGVPLRVKVAGISAKGVEIEAPALSENVFLPATYTRSARFSKNPNAAPDALDYVEFNQIPLALAIRLLADQTQENYVATEAAGKVQVSLFLRNVSPSTVVEELCKSHGLWSRRHLTSTIPTTRILTMEEFVRNLSGDQQAEQSKTFTLLYPNVTEVASIIQSLYADRVYLSLGSEEVLDDETDDLSRRFERFSMMSGSGSSQLMGGFNLNNNWNSGRYRSYSRRNSWQNNMNYLGSGIYFANQQNQQSSQELASRVAARETLMADGSDESQLTAAIQGLRRDAPVIYVTISRRNNMLVVRTADQQVMDDITALVEQLDVPTPMVLLEVKVVELNLTDELNTVFDFTAQGDFTYDGNRNADWNTAFPANMLLEKGLTFQLISDQFTSRIQLLQEKGNAKLIATPTLMTANNEVSQLFIGKEVPVVQDISSPTYVNSDNVVSTAQTGFSWERVGTMLLITPSINADRTVTFRLLQENSAIAAEKGSIPVITSNSVQYVAVDVIESRSISGTFVAQDQMTIAVGGLIREEETEIKSGIPLLMDIPILGWFFRSTQKGTTRSELIILITPHVISTPSESGSASSAYLQRSTRNPALNPHLPEDAQIPVKPQKEKK